LPNTLFDNRFREKLMLFKQRLIQEYEYRALLFEFK